jgi:nucleoid-associated protein YgaU
VQPNTQLARASIVDTTDGQIVSVMYNPDEMKLEQGNNFAEIGIPGLEKSPVQYVRGRARVLSMELFFDSYEDGQDVRVHTGRIVRLLEKRPETQAPPVLIFVMGGFTFRCVLVDAGQRFTMFRSDGMPVRSYLSIRLQEYVSVSVDIERGLFIGSPTVSAAANTVVSAGRALISGATVHVSLQGETLQGLAAALLGDPARWRDIADANGVEDPFNLPTGTRLMIPPR